MHALHFGCSVCRQWENMCVSAFVCAFMGDCVRLWQAVYINCGSAVLGFDSVFLLSDVQEVREPVQKSGFDD